MRIVPALLLPALLLPAVLAGCASDRSRHGPPPGAGPAGPPPGGGGRLFISPMGEPFRGGAPERVWFDGADTDRDGRVTRAEFVADAQRWFGVLDRGGDGEIDPDDIDHYETVLAPEIRVAQGGGGVGPGGGGGRGGGGRGGMGGPPDGGGSGGGAQSGRRGATDTVRRGAARYGWFDYPEPVTVADTNLNRGVDRTEWVRAAEMRFAILDRNGDGALTRGELPPAPSQRAQGFAGGHRPPPTPRSQEAEPDTE